jgi:acetyltransferase-like isoleucine patch superfamily enzyme
MKEVKLVLIKLIPEFFKLIYYKFIGSVGCNLKISNGSLIVSRDITIGNDVFIGKNIIIIADKVVIGDRVRIEKNTFIKSKQYFIIGKDSYIEEGNTIGGMQTPDSSIEIGDRVGIFPRCYINTTKKVIIMNDVGIGGESLIFTHGSWQNILEGYPFSFGDVVLEKNVWLPWRVFILPNVTIGENTTIGSASVVASKIPSNCFAAGIPCKVIKENNKKLLNSKEKFDLMHKILEEMVRYFSTFYHINYQIQVKSNSILLTSDNHQIYYTISNKDDIQNYKLVILDFDVEQLKENQLSIMNYSAIFSNDPIKLKVISFLTQYGIRFNYI